MGLDLFQKVPAEVFETVLDVQNQPLGKYVGIGNIRNNFKGFPSD